jgi:hypothetical protein
MDSEKRERLIQLGTQIAGLRTEIAALQSKLTETVAELDGLVPDSMLSAAPATNGTAPTATPAASPDSTAAATIAAREPPAPKRPELVIPPVIGSLSDQALAVIKANPDRQFSGETITNCLNQMARTAPANLDSVNAALSRLTTDGLILRVERGLYTANPSGMETNARVN